MTAVQMESVLAEHFPSVAVETLEQADFPRLAKDPEAVQAIERALKQLPTTHRLSVGDSRSLLSAVPDNSLHLVLTSPPYWTLKRYPENEAQLGHTFDYQEFLGEIDKIWTECFRVLVPGGRLIIVVGDVCLSRRRHGTHMVLPLHADIQVRANRIGFHNLAPIIWYKIANAAFEVENGSSFLGKPYEPNAVIKNDIEYILMQRKPGGYRQTNDTMRLLSLIGEEDHHEWFRQVWDLKGASTRQHPAPYPLELAERLIRMFSFVGDTVLDPFLGTGTTSIAAARWARNSVGFEVEASYSRLCRQRFADTIRSEGIPATVEPRLTELDAGTLF